MPIGQVALNLLGQMPRALGDFRFDLGRQILVGKIDRRLEMRQQIQQPLAPAAIERAELPVELP
jgi:hypothetical protein